MKIKNIRKALKITILMTVILLMPIMYTIATENAISYTVSEDKKSALIHIDVNKVIGNNDLIEVKDQDNNLLTEYDMTVTENGTYSYTVTYKEKVITGTEVVNEETTAENITEEAATTPSVEQTTENLEVPKEEIIIKNEILEITVKGIIKQEDLSNQQVDAQSVETEESSVSQNESTSLQASEVTPTSVDLFTFNENAKTITGYTGTSTDIVIPETINGVTVENIGEDVFRGKGITSVIFPKTIKSIKKSAFLGNRLKSLVLPENLEVIEVSAFSQLNYDLSYSEKREVFHDLVIPKSVKTISFSAFYGNAIENLTFMPDCDLHIGYKVFSNNMINKLDLSVGKIILNDPTLSGRSGDGIEVFYNNNIKSVKFNSYIEEIPEYAFANNEIEFIEFPSNIKEINKNAFTDNYTLRSIQFNEGLKIIGSNAFNYASNVTHIEIPNSVEEIGIGALNNMSLCCLDLSENIKSYSIDNSYLFLEKIYPNIVKKNNIWKLDLKTLDKDFEINRVGEIVALTGNKEEHALEEIEGKYDKDTGVVTFTSDPYNKKIAYYYLENGDNPENAYLFVNTHIKNILKCVDVHFDSINTKEVTVGEAYGELPSPSPRVGYIFKEWNTSSDGTGETITSDTIVTNENEHTLYPIFTPVSYEVTLIADNYNQVKNVYYDSPYGELPVIEKIGFDFIGWNSQSDGKGKYMTKDAILDKAENQTLYAIYKESETNSSDNNQTPNGEIILPGEDGEPGTDDDIIIKPGTIDDKGNIIIHDGGIIYDRIDKILGTQDDLLIRNTKETHADLTINNKTNFATHVLTSDDTQVLLWSSIGTICMFSVIISVKKKLKKQS